MDENKVLEKMKKEWFDRFQDIISNRGNIPSGNLKCLELCEARCCPRVGMRTMPPEEIGSPLVVLLPFEMEFIIEKTGVSRDVFRVWPVDMAPGLTLEVGMLDLGKPCPFLQQDMRCGIYDKLPLDCRTFPLLPYLDPAGDMQWALGENCPSLSFLSPAFTEYMKEIWSGLEPFLPRAWWDLYDFADHWTGYPKPIELPDAD